MHEFDRYLDSVKVNGKQNCPNCGAPIESEKCEYCGSVLVDFACIDADKPFFMKINKDGKVYILNVRLSSMETCIEYTGMYADNFPILSTPYGTLNMSFDVLR